MAERRGTHLARLVAEQPPAARLAVVTVPSDLIRLGEYEIRHGRDEQAIKELAHSIHDNGLFAPPGGIAAPSGHIDILMGNSRVLAMTSLLNWREIPVRVFHWWGDSTWDRVIAAFQENTVRRQMTFEEEVAVVYTYRQQTGETVREMARRFRKSKSWIHERVSWGKRVYGDRPVPKAPALRDDARSLKREQAPRVTLRQSEVKAWLDQLQELGVVPGDDGQDTGTHPCASSALRDLRRTMKAVICKLREDQAA
jgi:ParB-like chromosome segregation protein Spo0J